MVARTSSGSSAAASPPSAEHTFAVRAGRPFFEVLASRGLLPPWFMESFDRTGPYDRIALKVALSMLDNAVALSGDPDLGLHAALQMPIDTPLLEYVSVSSTTVREALETFARYVMLVNDALDVRLEVTGTRAVFQFESRVPMCRPAVDFQMSSFYLARLRWEASFRDRREEEISFVHPEPADTRCYREVFGVAQLRFGAPFTGLVFPAAWLEHPMGSADKKLHELLVRTVEEQVTDLPSRLALTQRVRGLLRESIAFGDSSAECIADRLQMSRRTLSRRLEQEGTTFKLLLDQTRCALTLRYLLADQLPISEIAARLGFAEPASFYKAFRRWFGTTPTEYVHRNTTRAQS
ncbi:MAG TPA: AraC family transcriptional regulator ligand-binding domain-containing protein [Polyangiaceae bacterium]|nr:AraC family transcriptional regulator ligand-binding domain-containing protein [Polyangiaceae bacterium]